MSYAMQLLFTRNSIKTVILLYKARYYSGIGTLFKLHLLAHQTKIKVIKKGRMQQGNSASLFTFA